MHTNIANEIFKVLHNLSSKSRESKDIDLSYWIPPILSSLSNSVNPVDFTPPYTSMINVLLNLPLKPKLHDYSIVNTSLIPMFVEVIKEAFPSSLENVDKASTKDATGGSIDHALIPLAAFITLVISSNPSVRAKAKTIIAPADL
jgi:hypothetical protein